MPAAAGVATVGSAGWATACEPASAVVDSGREVAAIVAPAAVAGARAGPSGGAAPGVVGAAGAGVGSGTGSRRTRSGRVGTRASFSRMPASSGPSIGPGGVMTARTRLPSARSASPISAVADW